MNPSTSAKKMGKIFLLTQPMHAFHGLLHAEARPTFFSAASKNAHTPTRLHTRPKSVGFLPFSF